MKSINVVAAMIIKHEMLKQVQHDGCVIQHDAPSAQHDWQASRHNDSSRQDDNRHSESTTACHSELDSESVCKVFVTQRGYGEWRGFWEFPGGKIEYDYPTFHLSKQSFVCQVLSGKLELLEHEKTAWLTKEIFILLIAACRYNDFRCS